MQAAVLRSQDSFVGSGFVLRSVGTSQARQNEPDFRTVLHFLPHHNDRIPQSALSQMRRIGRQLECFTVGSLNDGFVVPDPSPRSGGTAEP